MARLTDNDLQRNMSNEFKAYRALTFLRSKWELGGVDTPIAEESQQFGQAACSRRITVTASNVDLLALFDDNRQAYPGRGLHALFIGDGPAPAGYFHYGAEQVLKACYLLGWSRQASLTVDWQHVVNPAYNRDRGPVEVYGLRVHLEY